MRIKSLILCLILGITVDCFAQDSWWDAFTYEVKGSLGAGAIISEKPYEGVDTEVYVIPFARLYYRNFFFEGTRLGYELYKTEDIKFSPILQWRFDGYEEDDSDTLAGMDDRDMTLDGGAEVEFKTEFGMLRLSWVADLLSEHQGHEFEVGFSRRISNAFAVEGLSVIPNVSASYLSSDLADYYYGVRSGESIAGRPAYNTGSGINYSAGVNIIYVLAEKWDLIAGFEYTWLDDDIQDSPIVSEDGIFSFLAGVAYKF